MKTRIAFKLSIFFLLLGGLLVPFLPVHAEDKSRLPTFADFVTTVTNGQANIVRGVYVPGVMAYAVVTQPANNPGYVSQQEDIVTQFGMAAQYQVIGLLAHNFLAGAVFPSLFIGQEIRIIYGDGQVAYYRVKRVARFQALQSNSITSNFVDLNTQLTYSAEQLFVMFYEGGDHVTLQTCILRDGNGNWGRLFVVAEPISAPAQTLEMRVSQDYLR